MTYYKQLCAELLAALEEEASNWNLDPECHPLVVRARAALAEPEPEGPSFSDVMEWASAIEPWATWLAPGGCLENAYFEFDRLVTTAVARWGNHPGSPDSSGNLKAGLTRSPVAGEVAELARLMREEVSELRAGGHLTPDERLRAADLLERLSPLQPVPVSERLPEPKDCDAEGRCWWLIAGCEAWALGKQSSTVTHWLSAHALPSSGEGEA